MKRAMCFLMVLVFCVSLCACGEGAQGVETKLQGKWTRAAEAQSATVVTLEFSNGSVTRTETVNGSGDKVSNGSYTIDKDGWITITYTDGSKQSIGMFITESSEYLRDLDTGVNYFRG